MKKIHKKKKLQVTDTKILENTERWRQTYKGLTANLYAKVKERSRRNSKNNAEFTLAEFRIWLEQTNIHRLFGRWEKCGYKTDRRPSIDRINPLRGYTFENMQVITAEENRSKGDAEENRSKGDAEKIILWGKPVCQISFSGVVIATYPNIKMASQITKINKNNISSCVCGKRKTAGGYKWQLGNIYQNPELLSNTLPV